MNKKSGFTLIELLVVVSIISLLASIVLVSLGTVRARGRDARRKADLNNLVLAINLFYDVNGRYPSTATVWYASCWMPSGNWMPDGNPGQSVPSPAYNWSTGYIQSQPHDPVDTCYWPWDVSYTGPSASYAYVSNGTQFAIVARLENSSDKDTIQNAGTLWWDGNPLYSYHGWYGRVYGIVQP